MNLKMLLPAVLATAVTFAVASDIAANNPPLLTPMKTASAGADPIFRGFSKDRSTISTHLVHADARQVTLDRETLSLGSLGVAYKKYSYRNPSGTIVWYGTFGKRFGALHKERQRLTGEIADDPLNSIMIVRNENNLTATAVVKGRTYRLEPMFNGGHVLAEIDTSKLPPEAAPEEAPSPRGGFDPGTILQAAKTGSPGKAVAQAPATIRVMVVWTASAAGLVADRVAATDQAIALTNDAFINSGVNARVELALREVAWHYAGGATVQEDRQRFANTTDGFLDNYHAKRDEVKADVMVIVSGKGNVCGSAIMNANAERAFMGVYANCMGSVPTFAHELGHVFGASHEREESVNPYYTYGYGYYSPTKKWRTVLAYGCPLDTLPGTCPRISYYSNPNNTYNGERMGTATANNARVLNERASTVAAFR